MDSNPQKKFEWWFGASLGSVYPQKESLQYDPRILHGFGNEANKK